MTRKQPLNADSGVNAQRIRRPGNKEFEGKQGDFALELRFGGGGAGEMAGFLANPPKMA